MDLLRISAVSYLNSTPFVYGIRHSGALRDYRLELDVPSVCADKLIEGRVDLGLIPVAMIPKVKDARIVTDFCIGAGGKVVSVALFSKVPLEEIRTIYLDFESRTSVRLARILAARLWQIKPEWKALEPANMDNLPELESVVLIGDKTFSQYRHFPYVFDFAEEWRKLTGLPFTFACWVANKPIAGETIGQLNQAFAYGFSHLPEVVKSLGDRHFDIDPLEYLTKNLDFNLDPPKREAVRMFLDIIRDF